MQIAVYHELPSGGAKRSLFETLKRLCSKHKIDVYTLDTADRDFCDLRPFCASYRVFHFGPPRLFDSPMGRLNQLQRWWALWRLDHLTRKIAAEIDSRRYDVVFGQPSMWSQAPLVMRHLRTPVVYYCHEAPRTLYERDPRPDNQGNVARPIIDRVDPLIRLYHSTGRRLDQQATRAARRVLVNSEYMRRVVATVYGIDPQVCYHGVDSDLFRPLADAIRCGYVLSVGSIQSRKGFDFLIESLARIPVSIRPALRLVGNDEVPLERRYLQSLASMRDVDLRIEVGIGETDLVRRYNEAALVAYAPHNEPFGLVPLEAMACGTPVVGVHEGGVSESVVNGVSGLLVERDKELFARAVQSLLEQAELLDRYGRQARQLVLDRWSWERAVERVEEQLCSVSGRAATALV